MLVKSLGQISLLCRMLKYRSKTYVCFLYFKKIHKPHNALLLHPVFLILSHAGPERGGYLEGVWPLSSLPSLHTFGDWNVSVQVCVHREHSLYLWGWAPWKGQQYVIISERLLNCIDSKRSLGLGANYRRRLEGKGQDEASTAIAPLAQSDSVSQVCLRVQMANGHLQTDKPSGN